MNRRQLCRKYEQDQEGLRGTCVCGGGRRMDMTRHHRSRIRYVCIYRERERETYTRRHVCDMRTQTRERQRRKKGDIR